MKILLIGEFPPPYGGISVHVSEIRRQLIAAGIECRVLDTGRVGAVGFGAALLRYALDGWTLHVHTNGHNPKSWLIALVCGMSARLGEGGVLTLHSGLAPGYLGSVPAWRRKLAAVACALYARVVCVSPAIQRAIISLGIPLTKTEATPAWIMPALPEVALDAELLAWMDGHQPLFSTALFFRPEYGFDVLVAALAKLRNHCPSVGCVVMGSGEHEREARRRVREAGLEENILLLGDVEHDACLAVMSRSDVFIRPTFEDGDSISVREARSLGVPVVASRVGTRPPGVILFEPGEVEDLVAKLELAMVAGRSEPVVDTDSGTRLMEIYQQVVAPGEAYVST
jgi:glycogen(starch) synthase